MRDVFLQSTSMEVCMIYYKKITEPVKANDEFTLFLPKAAVSVKDGTYGITVDGASTDRTIVLNNNVTLSRNTADNITYIAGVDLFSSSGDRYISSGMASKTTKVTLKAAKAGEIRAYGWRVQNDLNIIGGFMRQNFTVSCTNTSDQSYAYGIRSDADIYSGDTIYNGKFTIKSKAEDDAYAYGLYAGGGIEAKDLAGKINVSTTAGDDISYAYGVYANAQGISISLDKLSGRIDVNANGRWTSSAGLYAEQDLTILNGFRGTINVNAKGIQYCWAGGLHSDASSVVLGGRNTGSITVSTNGDEDMYACCIYGNKAVSIANFSGALTARGTFRGTGNGNAYGIACNNTFTAAGDFSGKITASIQNSSKDTVDAIAIYAGGDVDMDDISGTWSVQAKSTGGTAAGLYSGGKVILDDVAAKITVSSADYLAKGIVACYKTADNSTFSLSADRISGNITVSGNIDTVGIKSCGNVGINDMSKMKLKVTGKNGEAYGIHVESDNNTDCENLGIGECGLNVGSITVNGKGKTYGILVNDSIGLSNDALDNRLTGKISAVSKGENAYGISAYSFSNYMPISANISVTAAAYAYGIHFASGDCLNLDGAKITAKTTSKGYYAYAICTEDAGDNYVYLTNNTILTGSIATGKYGGDSDVVMIESGSRLNGGLNNVENLKLYINDARKKNTAMWNANVNFSKPCDVDYTFDYGLVGDFKLITKSKNIEWSDLLNNSALYYNGNNSLYAYSTYTKGNNLYLSIKVQDALSGDMYFKTKRSSGVELKENNVLFSNKADINIKNDDLFVAEDFTAAIDAGSTSNLILDNNITVNYAGNSYATIYGVYGEVNFAVSAVNAAKTLKLTAKGENIRDVAGYYMHDGNFIQLGGRFLQNITVSGERTTTKGIKLCVSGISSDSDDVCITGDLVGKITVSGKANDDLGVFGIYAYKQISVEGNIPGAIKVTATGKKETRAYGLFTFSEGIMIRQLSGSISVTSSGNADYEETSKGAALAATAALLVCDFTGKITVNVKDQYRAAAYGFMSGDPVYYSPNGKLMIIGKNTGSLSVTADGKDAASAIGIYSDNDATLANYSGAITAKAIVNGDGNTTAAAINAGGKIEINGIFSSKLTVSAQNKNNAKGTVYASGISVKGAGNNIVIDDISGVWNISATGYDAGAYGIHSVNGGSITLGDLSGNKTITATSKNTGTGVATYGFDSAGSFTAEKISGNITVTATGSAYGFFSEKAFSVDDMSKMKLKVTSRNGTAYGICAGNSSESNLLLDDAGLNLGKITVNAYGYAAGLSVNYGAIKADSSCLNNVLAGNITAVSKTDSAVGILANEFDNVVCSATISATGKTAAIGIDFGTGDLTLDGAKITTKVTEKNNTVAYAVYSISKDDNTIELTGKSKLVGHINTGDGDENEEDRVIIESGSKLVGALENVEFVELKINDSTQSKNSMWDVIESDEMTRSKLWIDIDYGLTGDFLLATKKSTLEWDDVIDFSNDGEEIVLSTGDTSLNMTYNSCTYGDLNYEVKESGNKLILSVTEKS